MAIDKALVDRVQAGIATEQEMAELGSENVRAIKADTEKIHTRYAFKRAPRTSDPTRRTVEYEASNDLRDRSGDRVNVKGWKLDSFQKNPVLLWSHNREQPPIGKVIQLRKTREGDRNVLLARAHYFEGDKNPLSELIYRMVVDGDLPGSSVSFQPIKAIRPRTEMEARELGLGPYGIYYESQELLELSAVSVPANAQAVARKLDTFAEKGVFSYAVIDNVVKRLESEEAVRLKEALDFYDETDKGDPPLCEVVDELTGTRPPAAIFPAEGKSVDPEDIRSFRVLLSELRDLNRLMAERVPGRGESSSVNYVERRPDKTASRQSEADEFYDLVLRGLEDEFGNTKED